MGVVHLARRDDGDRVALKVLRPHIVGDEEARRRLEREVGSLRRVRSQWVAEIVDADPWGEIPYVATRYVPGLSLHDLVVEEGAVAGLGPDLAGRLPRRGHRLGARGRRAPPRREAVQRADGGPHPDPHRLRAGPGRRRPPAHPHRLAARHARLPRARDPVRRGRHRGLRRALVGGHGRLRRPRPSAVRPRPVDGDHGPGPPRPVRPGRAAGRPARGRRRRPRPRAAQPADPRPAAGLAAPADHPARGPPPSRRRRPHRTTRTPSRSRSPPRPARTTRPTSGPATTAPSRTRSRCRRTASRTSTRSREPSFAERFRRARCWSALAVAAGAGCAAFPWVTTTLLLLLVWLLRSGSLAASAHDQRRQYRGRKWYDGVQLLVAAPWHLVQSIPGTALLALWSLGLAVAAALVCYAIATGLALALFVCGVVLTVSLWLGPGWLPGARSGVAGGQPARRRPAPLGGRAAAGRRAGGRTRLPGRPVRGELDAGRQPAAESATRVGRRGVARRRTPQRVWVVGGRHDDRVRPPEAEPGTGARGAVDGQAADVGAVRGPHDPARRAADRTDHDLAERRDPDRDVRRPGGERIEAERRPDVPGRQGAEVVVAGQAGRRAVPQLGAAPGRRRPGCGPARRASGRSTACRGSAGCRARRAAAC